MKICNHCGAVLEDYALFCNNCGMSAKEDASINFEETNSQAILEENPYELNIPQENADSTQVNTQDNPTESQLWPHEKYKETKAPAEEYNPYENMYQQTDSYNPQPESFTTQNANYNPQPEYSATQNMGYNPQSQQPDYNPYNQTPYAEPPKPARMSVSARVLGIVGLVLSISGAVDTIVLTLYSFFLIFFGGLVAITEPATPEVSVPIIVIDIIYIFCIIFCAAPGIIGFALGKSAIRKGNCGKTPKYAKGFGLTTIILAAISVILLSMSMSFLC